MLEFPAGVKLATLRVVPIDYGFEQRPPAGGTTRRIDRPGNRFQASFSFPKVEGEEARVLISRLMRAKREGLRVQFPLPHPQGDPGAPVVDGSDSEGITLKLRGLHANAPIREGWWLTVIDAAGTRYFHNVSADTAAGADGKATLTIEPPLRCFPTDGNQVLIAAPEIEGLVTEVVGFGSEPGQLVAVDGFTIEERK